MTNLRIKVDGRTIYRGELGEWVQRPPDEFRDAIKPGAQPTPWMKGVLVAMSDAVAADLSTRITVKTHLDGWSMEVRHSDA